MSRESRPARQPGMIRETLKHAAIYSGANALGRMISFVMLPFYAYILRDIGYGVVGMIDAGLVLLGSLLAYNFQGAVIRIYHEETDPARKPSVVSTGTLLVAMLVVPIAGVGLLFSRPASDLLLGTPAHWNLICLALITFAMTMVSQTAQTILIIRRRSSTYSLIQLIKLLVGVSLNILLIVVLRWGLVGYFTSGLLTAVVGMVISLWVMIRHCGLGWDRELAGRLFRYQYPLVPGSIARFFARQIERVIVRYQIDLATLGVLEMAYKFPVLINMLVITPFITSWGTKSLEIADQPGAPRRIADVFSYFLYLATFGYLLLAVNIRTVLQLLTPPEFWEASRIARIDGLQVVFNGVAAYLAFGLAYAKRTDLMARIAMVVAAVKVVLSFALISVWGLYGAAWSGLLAAIATAIWRGLLSRRFYSLPLDWPKLILIAGSAVALVIGIDSLSNDAIVAWGQPAMRMLQRIVMGLEDTWFGTWKEGKVLVLLDTRGGLVLDLAVRTILTSAFLIILPIVHVETQRKLRRWYDALRRYIASR